MVVISGGDVRRTHVAGSTAVAPHGVRLAPPRAGAHDHRRRGTTDDTKIHSLPPSSTPHRRTGAANRPDGGKSVAVTLVARADTTTERRSAMVGALQKHKFVIKRDLDSSAATFARTQHHYSRALTVTVVTTTFPRLMAEFL